MDFRERIFHPDDLERLREVRKAALALARGGVGYYPHSDFIHLDVGRVRQWCFDCAANFSSSPGFHSQLAVVSTHDARPARTLQSGSQFAQPRDSLQSYSREWPTGWAQTYSNDLQNLDLRTGQNLLKPPYGGSDGLDNKSVRALTLFVTPPPYRC